MVCLNLSDPTPAEMDQTNQRDDLEDVTSMKAKGKLAGFQPFIIPDEERKSARKRQIIENWDFVGAHKWFEWFYLCANGEHLKADLKALFENGEFKSALKNANGEPGINLRVKIVSRLRVFAFIKAFEQLKELCKIAEATKKNSFPY